MNNEEKTLLEYKKISEKIVEALEKSDFVSFYDLTEEREKILLDLKNMDLNKVSQEVRQNLNVDQLQKEINKLIKNKLQEYKNEMASIVRNREAHNAYNDHLKRQVHFNTQV
ncbi:hypothetical protein SAMN02745248_00694 [Hathewaya proteolytica DSM 3090]|uniref:Flagellar protein FliT n=1 Tax=Hathewaya proteolytica DSM 3090 TaxID=1121331 RepID=A0A1M6LBB7_9CLOT|nr:hypothetical protein [Hathewaya proteolytica]SHJ68454.1 hypothetical protein SAMN02745248_00694 [Hathewaya proteolytica DSM 3090]